MSEKTEGAIKNGQSRETGSSGWTRHKTKTNKAKNTTQKLKRWATRNPPKTTTQKTKKMSNKDPNKKNLGRTKVLLKGSVFYT